MKNRLIICYFLVLLAVLVCVFFCRPLFSELTTIYSVSVTVVLYLMFAQLIAIAATVTISVLQGRKRPTFVFRLFKDVDTAMNAHPERNEILPMSLPEWPGSARQVPVHAVAESGSPGVAFSVVERSHLKINFELTHPDFFRDKKNRYPFLSINEIWLLAFEELKLSTTEIAAILDIDSGSVRRTKTGIQRKLRDNGVGLTDSQTKSASGTAENG